MRMLLVVVSFVALGSGSYWALTAGPFAPGGGGLAGIRAELAATADEAFEEPPPAYVGGQAVTTRLTRRTYPVAGATAAELLEAMLADGPRSGEDIFFGLTETELDVRYDPVELDGGCIIRDVRVALDVRVTLPEWAPPAGVDARTVADWRAFRRALEAHEDRHRQIAADGAERAFVAISELYRPSCADAEDEGRRRLERIGVEVSAAHRQFDVETSHGKADGALWPPAP